MVEKQVLVIRPPTWSGIFVDFDLNHCLDAVDDFRDFDFPFLLWWCRWLLHLPFSTLPHFPAASRSQSFVAFFAAAKAASKTLG